MQEEAFGPLVSSAQLSPGGKSCFLHCSLVLRSPASSWGHTVSSIREDFPRGLWHKPVKSWQGMRKCPVPCGLSHAEQGEYLAEEGAVLGSCQLGVLLCRWWILSSYLRSAQIEGRKGRTQPVGGSWWHFHEGKLATPKPIHQRNRQAGGKD